MNELMRSGSQMSELLKAFERAEPEDPIKVGGDYPFWKAVHSYDRLLNTYNDYINLSYYEQTEVRRQKEIKECVESLLDDIAVIAIIHGWDESDVWHNYDKDYAGRGFSLLLGHIVFVTKGVESFDEEKILKALSVVVREVLAACQLPRPEGHGL